MSGKIIDIFFCVREKMPFELMSIAMRQGLDCDAQDIIAIKTKHSETKPTVEYEFEVVTPTPEGIRDYMEKLARQDGDEAMDFNEMLRRAFLDDEL